MKKTDIFTFKYRYIVALFFALIAIRAVYYSFSEGFSLTRINCPSPKEVPLPPPTKDELKTLQKIVKEEFRYLGKGSQAYAFISHDGQYILKLFKFYHFRPMPFLDSLLENDSTTLLGQHLIRRYKKRDLTINSYRIAREELSKECGIYYLQISPSTAYHLPVTLVDRLGRTYKLDLEKYGYLIQKRANLIYPTLDKWIEEKDFDAAKRFLHNLIQLIVKRSRMGIQDQDPDLHKNAGVVGEEAIFIDVGSFHTNKNAADIKVYSNDLKKITRELLERLLMQSPELHQYLQDELKANGVSFDE